MVIYRIVVGRMSMLCWSSKTASVITRRSNVDDLSNSGRSSRRSDFGAAPAEVVQRGCSTATCLGARRGDRCGRSLGGNTTSSAAGGGRRRCCGRRGRSQRRGRSVMPCCLPNSPLQAPTRSPSNSLTSAEL